MVRAWCLEKLIDWKKIKDVMETLGLKEMPDQLAKGNGMQWYGRALRRDGDQVFKEHAGL